jgi:SSS family transporter
MLGLVGAAYVGGVSAFWLIPGCAAGYLFNWLWLAPRLRRATTPDGENVGALTLPEYLGRRFQSVTVRLVATVIVVAAMLGYVAAQMTAAGKAFDAVFGLPYAWGVALGTGIILVYMSIGGFRADVWTDFLQALMMIAALVLLPIVVLYHAGGVGDLISTLRETDSSLLSPAGDKMGFALLGLVLGWLGIGLGYPGQPHVTNKFMAARDDRSLRVGAVVALAWSITVFAGAIVLGLGCRALFPDLADPEQSLPIAADRFLAAPLAGLILAAVLAAICSTADGQLLVCVSAIGHDLVDALGLRRRRLSVRRRDGTALTAEDRAGVGQAVVGTPALHLIGESGWHVEADSGEEGRVEVAIGQVDPAESVHRFKQLVCNPHNLVVEEREIGWLKNALVVILGLAAMTAALSHNRVIFTFVLYAWSALGASFGPVLILALSWRGMTKAGAIAGMVVGAAVTVIWKNIPVLSGALYELVPAFVCAFIAAIIASWVSQVRARQPYQGR